MNPLMITLLSLVAFLALLVLLLLLGVAKIHVVLDSEVKVVASVFGIRFTLFPSKKEARKQAPVECRNPEKTLRKERKLLAKQQKKEQKKRRKAKKEKASRGRTGMAVQTNLPEKLDMVLALLKELYAQTNGKIRIRVKAFHISVGTDDAAKTALLYGVVLQSVSCLVGWLDTSFNRLRHKDGEMSVTADYLSGKCHASIDIVCGVSLLRGCIILVRMLSAKEKQERIALKKAKKRLAKSKTA